MACSWFVSFGNMFKCGVLKPEVNYHSTMQHMFGGENNIPQEMLYPPLVYVHKRTWPTAEILFRINCKDCKTCAHISNQLFAEAMHAGESLPDISLPFRHSVRAVCSARGVGRQIPGVGRLITCVPWTP